MVEPLLLLLLGVLVILAIIAANGYFVAQEFAYMAVDRTRLSAKAAEGDASAALALSITKRTSFMLSGAQLGITVTGLLVGYVAEPLVGQSLAVLLGGVGVPTEVGIGVGTVLALLFATIVQMIFGELFPKNLAIANPEPLARALAPSTKIYLGIFGWLISFFDMSANLFLRLLRIEPVHDLDVSASSEDLPHIIADSRDSGDLPLELSLMMDRILDFPHRNVEHAMVPRAHVDWVAPDCTVDQLRGLMAEAHTRYPVVDQNDEPVGVVQLADILPHLINGGLSIPASQIMQSVTIIPTLMSLPDVLERMMADGNQLVCVIDEYGGFAGVLTLEDIAMEVVGEITDEHDEDADAPVISESDHVWVMEGDVHLDEVERAISQVLPRGDFETIAGMLIAELGALPAEGSTVIVELPTDPADLIDDEPVRRRLKIDVLEVERHVPTRVRVKLIVGEE